MKKGQVLLTHCVEARAGNCVYLSACPPVRNISLERMRGSFKLGRHGQGLTR